MKDLEIILTNKPGALALLGETLGKYKISLEGGGVFQNGKTSIAHFLVKDAARAKEVLALSGMNEVKINEVVIQKLRQDVPGQLGQFCRRMADNGINILAQYSDHDHQLVVIVDKIEKGRKVSREWMNEWFQ